MVEPPDTAAKVDELMALAERRLGRSRGALRRVADDEVDLAIRVGTSVADLLDDHVQDLAGLRRDYRAWFCEERIGPLQEGFDAVDLVLEVGQYLSAKVMQAVSPTDRSPRLESLIELHALSVLVSNETIDLLRGGWPAAAEARWRTLHEAEVIALFLTKAPQSVSRRYLDSFATDMHRLLRRRLVRLPPGRAATTLRRQFAERSERAATEHGVAITHPYGWAARWLRKKRVTFADLEKRGAPRRPAYVAASNRVHAGRVGALYSLLEGSNHLMTGRRADGLVDVALKTLWSANSTAAALLEVARSLTGDESYRVWDEVQTELAAEADIQLRRAEMSRLIEAGRAEEAEAMHPPPRAMLIRMIRDAGAPARR